MEEKDSIEIASITTEPTQGQVRSFLEAEVRSIEGRVISKGFEVVMDKQIDFIKPGFGSQVFVTLVASVSKEGASQRLPHLIRRIEAARRRKLNPANVEALSARMVEQARSED